MYQKHSKQTKAKLVSNSQHSSPTNFQQMIVESNLANTYLLKSTNYRHPSTIINKHNLK